MSAQQYPACTRLDMQADPASHSTILVHVDVQMVRHLAGNATVLDVDAPQQHWRHLIESQSLWVHALA